MTASPARTHLAFLFAAVASSAHAQGTCNTWRVEGAPYSEASTMDQSCSMYAAAFGGTGAIYQAGALPYAGCQVTIGASSSAGRITDCNGDYVPYSAYAAPAPPPPPPPPPEVPDSAVSNAFLAHMFALASAFFSFVLGYRQGRSGV